MKYKCYIGSYWDQSEIDEDNEKLPEDKKIIPFFESNNFKVARHFMNQNTDLFYKETSASMLQNSIGCYHIRLV